MEDTNDVISVSVRDLTAVIQATHLLIAGRNADDITDENESVAITALMLAGINFMKKLEERETLTLEFFGIK